MSKDIFWRVGTCAPDEERSLRFSVVVCGAPGLVNMLPVYLKSGREVFGEVLNIEFTHDLYVAYVEDINLPDGATVVVANQVHILMKLGLPWTPYQKMED